MKIQFNTDKTIDGNQKNIAYFTAMIANNLIKYESHITRIEVHLSDENGNKEGKDDKRCLLEARLEGRKPMAVSHQANTIELAISGAIDKLKASLETILDRLANH